LLFCSFKLVFIILKYTEAHFLKAVPLFAHTTQALTTGRYPLQSGLRTSELLIKTDLSINCI